MSKAPIPEDLIPVNVWLAGRSYRLRIAPQEEAAVRRAVKRADDHITEMRQHYAGKDDQDFVAMCLLMYATDTSVAGSQSFTEDLEMLLAKIEGGLSNG